MDGVSPEHRARRSKRATTEPVVPGGLKSTNRTGGGSSASGSGCPGTLPRRDDGTQDPPPVNDWTAQVQAPAANPDWAQEQFAQWQLFHQQCKHLQCQQQLVASSTTDPWQVLPEDGGSTGEPVEYGHGNGSDWCVIAQPNTTSESESINHQKDWSGNAWYNDGVKDVPVLTAPELAAVFRDLAFGHATAHWPCFGLQQKPETGLASSPF